MLSAMQSLYTPQRCESYGSVALKESCESYGSLVLTESCESYGNLVPRQQSVAVAVM